METVHFFCKRTSRTIYVLSGGGSTSFLLLLCLLSAVVRTTKVTASGLGEGDKGDVVMLRLMLVTIVASHRTDDTLLSECQVISSDLRKMTINSVFSAIFVYSCLQQIGVDHCLVIE